MPFPIRRRALPATGAAFVLANVASAAAAEPAYPAGIVGLDHHALPDGQCCHALSQGLYPADYLVSEDMGKGSDGPMAEEERQV